MLTRRIVGMVLLACIVVVPVRATTYYVTKDGNDANSGSEAQPWETIQKAADTMRAGDTVNIKAGTYVERVRPKHTGSEGNWITYQAYGDGEVKIESPNDDPNNNYCIILGEGYRLEYLHFKNLTLRGIGQWSTNACFLAKGDTYGDGVKSHIILEGLTITNARMGVYFVYGVTDSNIIDCNIYNNGNGIYCESAIRNTLISGNHISYCYAEPNRSNGDGILISGQKPESSMCSDITITNNLIHNANRQGILIWGSRNVLVRGNHCHHNVATGIQIEGSSLVPTNKNIVVEDNLCEDNSIGTSETGIWVDDSNDVIVQNNIMRRSGKGLEIGGSFNVIARNNIIYENNSKNNSAAGIFVSMSKQKRVCENNVIVHNTLYRNAGFDTGVFAQVVIGWSRVDLNVDRPADNTVFKNNISSCSLAGGYRKYLDLWIYGQNLELNCNNYYQPVESLNVCWQSKAGKVNTIRWSDYLLRGQDSNSITSDPCFINPYEGDFHLRSASKCIDAGAFLTTAKDTNSGTSLVVADSRYFTGNRYFTDGNRMIDGDLIKVGSNPLVRVLDVNYGKNTLSLERSISWNAGDGVSYAYLGNSPDIGAYEYGSSATKAEVPHTKASKKR